MANQEFPEDDRHTPNWPRQIAMQDEAKLLLIAQNQIMDIAKTAASEGARMAIIQMWHQLGVKWDDADGVSAINEDLRWMRRTRTAREEASKSLKEKLADGVFSVLKYVMGVAGLYVVHLIAKDTGWMK